MQNMFPDVMQHMQRLLDLEANGTEADFEKFAREMQAPKGTPAEAAAQPQTDRTWIVAMKRSDSHELGDPEGTHELEINVSQVEADGRLSYVVGGAVWPVTDPAHVTGGAGFAAWAAEMMFQALYSAMIKPANPMMLGDTAFRPPANLPRGRPQKLLVTSSAHRHAMKTRLDAAGIAVPVKTAKADQIDQAMARLVKAYDRRVANYGVAGGGVLHTVEQMAKRSRNVKKGRGKWRVPRDLIESGIPESWFVNRPADASNYRANQLWGWRTDFEAARKEGDVAAMRKIAAAQDREALLEFMEMRMMLTMAAQAGVLSVCKVLVELGALLEGVQAPGNKPSWRKCQETSGNNGPAAGSSPLLGAANHNHPHIVTWMLAQGADPDSREPRTQGTSLHGAAAKGFKGVVRALLRGGATDLPDRNGYYARDVARESAQALPGDAVALQIQEMLAPGSKASCGACGRPAAPKRCPCGGVVYCGPACQKADWKAHKATHKVLEAENRR